jgi:hypothetical protein
MLIQRARPGEGAILRVVNDLVRGVEQLIAVEEVAARDVFEVGDEREGVIGDRLLGVQREHGDGGLEASPRGPSRLRSMQRLPADHRLPVGDELNGADDERGERDGPENDNHHGGAPTGWTWT